MKTFSFREIVLGSLLPLGVALMIAGCGDGGSSNRISPGSLRLNFEQVRLIKPSQGYDKACLAPTFELEFLDAGACSMSAEELQQVVRLYKADEGASNPIPLNRPIPRMSRANGNTCRLEFTIDAAESQRLYGRGGLSIRTKYYFGIFESPESSSRAILPDFGYFTTGDQNQSCYDGSAFIPEFIGGINGKLVRTNIDEAAAGRFLTTNGEGETTWGTDWDLLMKSAADSFSQLYVGAASGISNTPSATVIRTGFNKPVDKWSARENFRLYKFNEGLNPPFELVDTSKGCAANAQFGDNSCLTVEGAFVYLRTPNSGLVSGKYALFVTYNLISLSGLPLGNAVQELNSSGNSTVEDEDGNQPTFSYMTVFTVK